MMRRLILLIASLFVLAAFGMPSVASAGMEGKAMKMEGYVIDTKCATDNKADLANFVMTHTKECTLMPPCAASGYNLYSGGKLWKFDKKSSDKVHEFLKKNDSKLKVNVEVEHGEGDMIKLVSIMNAK